MRDRSDVALDERAVEVAAAGDFGLIAIERLAAYDRRENSEHLALRAIATDPREITILDELIRGDAIERARIERSRSLFQHVTYHARRLAGFLSVAR